MLEIHDDGRSVRTAAVVPRGGILVLADARADIQGLIRLCLNVREESRHHLASARSEQLAMRRLYGQLVAGAPGFSPQTQHEADVTRWVPHDRHPDPLDALILALTALVAAWPNSSDRSREAHEGLKLLLGIAGTFGDADGEIRFDFDGPRAALVLQPGSVIAGFSMSACITATSWVAAVVGMGASVAWRSADAAATALVNDLRIQAQSRVPKPYDLIRLDGHAGKATRDAQVAIVFLHGLFGTDLGTFDGLIEGLLNTDVFGLAQRLQSIATTRPNCVVADEADFRRICGLHEVIQALEEGKDESLAREVQAARERPKEVPSKLVRRELCLFGWPHNTLTGIRQNATELAEHIEWSFVPAKMPIVFVAHSRGGLVARAAIVALAAHDPAWLNRCRIVTFGTPHEGAELAENGLRQMATYYLALAGAGSVANLLDVLVYLQARTAEGIENLKCLEATTSDRPESFLSVLFEQERTLRNPPAGQFRVPITAIGGVVDDALEQAWRRRAAAAFVSWQLGRDEHDVVVSARSSMGQSRLNPHVALKVTSDHFGYFSTPSRDALDLVLGAIWSTVDLQKAFSRLRPPIKPSKPLTFKPSPSP